MIISRRAILTTLLHSLGAGLAVNLRLPVAWGADEEPSRHESGPLIARVTVKWSPMMRTKMLTLLVAVALFAAPVLAAERHMMEPRVPIDKLAEARALKSPFSNSPEVIEQGRTVYHGKGTCFTCHGADGDGHGPAAAKLNPLPRNFQHHGFWRHRTEGELFWIIKHGSPGTAMIGFGQALSDEEIWALIHYERTFAGRHGSGMRGQRGHRGPGGLEEMGGMGQR